MILRKCDLCGRVGDPKDRWDELVVFCEFVVPAPDGVNHKVCKHDLCSDCRKKIHEAVNTAFGLCRGATR